MKNRAEQRYEEAVTRNINNRVLPFKNTKTIEQVKGKLGIRQKDSRFDKQIKKFIDNSK
jgi:hypothetical protein